MPQLSQSLLWLFLKKIPIFSQFYLIFTYFTSYIYKKKKVHGYLISLEPQVVRIPYKDHLNKLKYRLP